jgi:hypothetical protein
VGTSASCCKTFLHGLNIEGYDLVISREPSTANTANRKVMFMCRVRRTGGCGRIGDAIVLFDSSNKEEARRELLLEDSVNMRQTTHHQTPSFVNVYTRVWVRNVDQKLSNRECEELFIDKCRATKMERIVKKRWPTGEHLFDSIYPLILY